MKLNIGIADNDCKKIADNLSHLLADTYTLYLKTQNFHWNVTGSHFHDLHLMLESQYEELADAVDEIAERIRALGASTPASFAQFLKLTSIKEVQKQLKAEEMLEQLLADHEEISRKLRDISEIAEKAGDEGTADLYAQRGRAHEKTAWMLRSTLQRA